MQALRALTAKKAQEAKELAAAAGGADKAFLTKAQLEEAKLKKIREEEEREREERERKRQATNAEASTIPDDLQRQNAEDQQLETVAQVLSREEVIRRLRALGEPAVLFGEEDYDRIKRLKRAERDLNKVNADEDVIAAGGRNQLIDLQRQGKKDKKAGGGAGGGGDKAKAGQDKGDKGEQAGGAGGQEEEDPTLAAFKKAAAALAEQRKEEGMSINERISALLTKWCKQWEEDMEARSEEVKQSPQGVQATLTFKTTIKNFEPLHERLKRNSLNDELRTGLWMMVQAMRDRNYLAANDVYLRLAIGNAPWPIGVTSVGIHERSAREKISHVMNTQGQAHIMNDEATRKYFQAMKRLVTQMQRMYPTDPSRCMNFDTVGNAGMGATGGGSAKAALLEAQARGELPLALPAAPHFMDRDNSVAVPAKWGNILKRARSPSPGGDGDGEGREASPALARGGGH